MNRSDSAKSAMVVVLFLGAASAAATPLTRVSAVWNDSNWAYQELVASYASVSATYPGLNDVTATARSEGTRLGVGVVVPGLPRKASAPPGVVGWCDPETGYCNSTAGSNAWAFLFDTLLVPGTGTATLSFAIPIHGVISDDIGWYSNTMFVLGVSGYPGQDLVWRTGPGTATYDLVLTGKLVIPRGVALQFMAELASDASNRVEPGAATTAKTAMFLSTAEIQFVRLQDENLMDLPMGLLLSDSGLHYGIGAAAVVPEPGTLALVLAGLGMALARRKWR